MLVSVDIRKLLAECLGTLFLLATVVGSGIMADSLSNDNAGVALLGNSISTGSMLVVLILIFGPVSGGHFNPAVTMSFYIQRKISKTSALIYVLMQVLGSLLGVLVAHMMFDHQLFELSSQYRTGPGQWAGEFVATFGLVGVIMGCTKNRSDAVPYAVGLYITGAYWFTSSTSFANPAVTLARGLTSTFTGIHPHNIVMFIMVQLIAALAATYFFKWLFHDNDKRKIENKHKSTN